MKKLSAIEVQQTQNLTFFFFKRIFFQLGPVNKIHLLQLEVVKTRGQKMKLLLINHREALDFKFLSSNEQISCEIPRKLAEENCVMRVIDLQFYNPVSNITEQNVSFLIEVPSASDLNNYE